MRIRQARQEDAGEISGFLQQLQALGKRSMPSDEGFVLDHYIMHPDALSCAVAEDEGGALIGLQSLKRASRDNPYGVTPGWGIIGTHVKPGEERRGVGRALFASTLEAAQAAGLKKIDASMAARSAEALGFYEALGFQTYRTTESQVCKCFDVP